MVHTHKGATRLVNAMFRESGELCPHIRHRVMHRPTRPSTQLSPFHPQGAVDEGIEVTLLAGLRLLDQELKSSVSAASYVVPDGSPEAKTRLEG